MFVSRRKRLPGIWGYPFAAFPDRLPHRREILGGDGPCQWQEARTWNAPKTATGALGSGCIAQRLDVD